MAEGEFYNKVELLEEARRYKTSERFLQVLYNEFNGSKRLLLTGLGPRLLTITSAITDELYGIDVNQGSIDRAREYIDTWKGYINEEPFKAEFDFLKKTGLAPKFDNYHFYLGKIPPYLECSFDGQLASELFLHLSPDEIKTILDNGVRNLRLEGNFVFTVYILGHEDSLDEEFYKLASKIGMKRDEFIENGIVNIKKLSGGLRRKGPDLYNENKDKYWLDLKQVRVFPAEFIEDLCKESGFKIKSKEEIRCGMFPFAYRLVYVLNTLKASDGI